VVGVSRGRWWRTQNRTGGSDEDGRRGQCSVASKPGRRENGDNRVDSGAWKRKKGGGVRASVMHLVARQRGGDGVRWPARHATGGDERCRADDSRGLNGAADRWV
jgi:hypothetical protein